jgi:hypothetical protein
MSYATSHAHPSMIRIGTHILSSITFLAITKMAANMNIILRNQPLILHTGGYADPYETEQIKAKCINFLKDSNIHDDAIEIKCDGIYNWLLQYDFPLEHQNDLYNIFIKGCDPKKLMPIMYFSNDRLENNKLSPEDSVEMKSQAGYLANNYLQSLSSFYIYSPLAIQAMSSALWFGYGASSVGRAGQYAISLLGLPTKLFLYSLSLVAFCHHQRMKAYAFGLNHSESNSEIEAFLLNRDKEIEKEQERLKEANKQHFHPQERILQYTISFLHLKHLKRLKNLGYRYLNQTNRGN